MNIGIDIDGVLTNIESWQNESAAKYMYEKYNKSIAELSEKATAKEFKFVMSYIAQEANRRQRELVGMKD